MTTNFNLEEILRGTIDFIKGLLARVRDGLHPESITHFCGLVCCLYLFIWNVDMLVGGWMVRAKYGSYVNYIKDCLLGNKRTFITESQMLVLCLQQ